MSLPAGTRVGSYEVLAPLGAGGMGEVYRARDTKLRREVALKVLPDAFALDRDRLARFTREAQVLASLNHPHIAQIYGLEEGAAESGHTVVHALAMELVAGTTLERLLGDAAGHLDMARIVAIARQVADALAAAHDKGIVHRDLKPANLMVADGGTVKVLDFGLAKAVGAAPASGPLDVPDGDSPTTMPSAVTEAGLVLGTAAYMSPEQARGNPVDARTDVWAFGCVLYEMLAGRRAFQGRTVTDTIAAILRDEPDWTHLRADTPPVVRWIVERCLRKDIHNRLQSLGDVRLMLDDERLFAAAGENRVEYARPARAGWVVAGLAVVALAVTGTFAWRHWREVPTSTSSAQFVVQPPDGMTFGRPLQVAVSPDGRHVVFTASTGNTTTLWLRPLDSIAARPLTGTEGAGLPFWSPDNRSIGFFAAGKLKVLQIDGGLPRVVCDATVGRGGTWNKDDVILFAPAADAPIMQVKAAGGAPSPVTRLDPPRENSHRSPSFLPDGRHFLYMSGGQAPTSGIGWQVKLGSLDAQETTVLVEGMIGSWPIYSAGHVLFGRDGSLMAIALDSNTHAPRGTPYAVASQPVNTTSSGNAGFAASADGVLAFMPAADTRTRLAWIDRSGRHLPIAGDPALFLNLSISPDGRRAVVGIEITRPRERDLWTIDLANGRRARVTFDPADEATVIWSPDGTTLYYSSSRNGSANLFRRAADGGGSEELLQPSNRSQTPTGISADGSVLLFTQATAAGTDIWWLPLTGDRKPMPIVEGPSAKGQARLSPNGRWLAYQSNETGRDEVFVVPFPKGGRAERVSREGGRSARWRDDGRELFFLAGGSLMVASVETGDRFFAGAPRPLFPLPVLQGLTAEAATYDVAKGGERFLAAVSDPVPDTRPLIVTTDWRAATR